MAQDTLVPGFYPLAKPPAPHVPRPPKGASMLEQLATGSLKAGLFFAGQGFPPMDTLATLARGHATVRRFLQQAHHALHIQWHSPEFQALGLAHTPIDLPAWLDAAARPDPAILLSTPISHLTILATQIAQYIAAWEEGLHTLWAGGHPPAFVTGHSQGMLSALLVAECDAATGELEVDRAVEFMTYALWQGACMEQAWRQWGHFETQGHTHMVAIAGPDTPTLEALLEAFNASHPPHHHVRLVIHTTRTRHVLSGPAPRLLQCRALLEGALERASGKKKQGQFAGRLPTFHWDPIPVAAAFHHPMLASALPELAAHLQRLGFTLPPSSGRTLDLLCSDTGTWHDQRPDHLTQTFDWFAPCQFTQPVRWRQTMHTIATATGPRAVDLLIDLGPGDGIAKLSRAALRGSGIEVVSLANPQDRKRLYTPATPAPHLVRYGDFAPQKRPDGRLENFYTRATHTPPFLLPGMTPTTAEAPIVAAAANAGYWSELAGGGQPTEKVFWARMNDLQAALRPGMGVIFNALYLDRHLWDLHLGSGDLVVRAAKAGYPLCGVTITAGIPPLQEAIALLDRLVDHGLWKNAFKPGNLAQVKQVVEIAQAAPEHLIFMHLEGGKAGGHHSWEDLNDLLLDAYHLIRDCQNLVLCVGGGIGTPERAADYLDGSWSTPFGELPMPVDAVFMGTIFMASKEALTSPQVKDALVRAQGTDRWVFAGHTSGLVTSGKSGLNADIHYLDNPASACGHLLDQVAGDAQAVAARKDEIIAALDATAKPYFGDLEAMTYLQWLERMAQLMAIGDHSPYADGPWADASYRSRFAQALWLTEARLTPAQEGPIESILPQDLSALDDPSALLDRLHTLLPAADTTLLQPEDALTFVERICKAPGKPVNFVPVIDADVRRWYKSDALWQAHDPRWDADAVLVIPGPAAVAGITQANEPVKDTFDRFMHAIADRLTVTQARVRTAWATPPVRHMEVTKTQEGWHLVAHSPQANWFSWIADHVPGPLGQIWRTLSLQCGPTLLPNPLRKLCAAAQGGQIWIDDASIRCRPDAHAMSEVSVTLEGPHTLIVYAHDDDPRRPDHAIFHLPIHAQPDGFDYPFFVHPHDHAQAILDLYGQAIFGQKIDPVDRFTQATSSVSWSPTGAQSYLHTVGDGGTTPPLNLAFSLAWKALFATLADAEFAPHLLQLVHLSNDITAGPAWPPSPGSLQAHAHLESIARGPRGATLSVHATLVQDSRTCATLRSTFFIRDLPTAQRPALERRQSLTLPLHLDPLTQGFLASKPFLQGTLPLDTPLILKATLSQCDSHFQAQGTIADAQGQTVATVDLDLEDRTLTTHPLLALKQALQFQDTKPVDALVTRKLLWTETLTAPSDMMAFALASGDKNPIHTSPMFARLASLPGPIVHGMWTAGALAAALRKGAAAGDGSKIKALDVSFLNILEPGAPVEIKVHRVGVDHGALIVEATAYAHEVAVARARATVAPPRTAYLFPGQGIQRQNMGMEGHTRSPAAREIWTRADAHTQAAMGFSILDVVRRNPPTLWVQGQRLTHPQGVLHLTQFTQVAMATLARAQMAELREAGVFDPESIAAGHSIGEYNVIGAVLEVLPLEETLSVVYQRGLAMHELVPRNEHGQSDYAMGVVRPHYAGMTHTQAEELVAQIAQDHDTFLQIVNYNVKGKQYAVTGTLYALDLLQKALATRTGQAKKPAYLPVPGIDVPFHSRALTDGVSSFRDALEANIPSVIDHEKLVGRYVPNLTATPFALTEAYVRQILSVVDSTHLHQALADWPTWQADPPALARLMLIELLAWQFASPVRWIETQDLFFTPAAYGGLGVERVVEVGVGTQPTVANMAKATLAMAPPGTTQATVYNVEADFDLVFLQDQEIVQEAPVAEPALTEGAAPASVQAATQRPVASPTVATTLTDRSPTHLEGLTFLLALQAGLRPEQITPSETIDEIFEGVSSKRNQLLMDLGTEFGVGAIDGAHELPLSAVAKALQTQAPGWRGGPYMQKAIEEAVRQGVGRAGISRGEVEGQLEKEFGLGQGLRTLALMQLVLERREGTSVRGGELGKMAGASAATKAQLPALLDTLAACLGTALGLTVGRASLATGGGGVVSSEEVDALKARVMGPKGVLMHTARAIAQGLGHELEAPVQAEQAAVPEHVEVLEKELGQDFARHVAPQFDARRHVKFASGWASAQRQVAQLFHGVLQGTMTLEHAGTHAGRLACFAQEPRVKKAALWHAAQAKKSGHPELAHLLEGVAAGSTAYAPPLTLTAPVLEPGPDGTPQFREQEVKTPVHRWLDELFEAGHVQAAEHDQALQAHLHHMVEAPSSLVGRTALVTGASPNSIAAEVVGRLLGAGARVVVTTTTATPERMAFYRALYDAHCVPGAELHVVTFNQASVQDIDALIQWLFEPVSQTSGGTTKKLKDPTPPDLVLPFGAIKDLAPTDALSSKSEAALRALLVGVERLVTGIGRARMTRHLTHRPCHVVLPLSPNHGTFGGDGLYGEGKAALEVLLNKWHSEQERWGGGATLCGAVIGWVRSTGLMDENDLVAPGLEAQGGVTTFSGAEMGWLIGALCADEMQHLCAKDPWMVNLSGGLKGVRDLRTRVGQIRQKLQEETLQAVAANKLETAYEHALGHVGLAQKKILAALPSPSSPTQACSGQLPEHAVELGEMVVIVGAGEIGPYGSARARFEFEVMGALKAQSVLEVAWSIGLVERQGDAWVKAGETTPVAEEDLARELRAAVMERIGIRPIDPKSAAFDPEALTTYAETYLERDLVLHVATREEAQSFLEDDPERTDIRPSEQGWQVTRRQGSVVRVPKRMTLDRTVAGTVPDGFDFAKFGISPRLQAQTDRVTLFNLVATVDAWVSSGISPEEILEVVHPARVGNTQSSGIGGMRSLDRLYLDPALGKERQADVLQETLLNVMAAYVAQSYMGSYGPMTHPVGACATAALSLEAGMEKILLNKADFVITGGFDDIGAAGMIGFADMNATAPTQEMLDKGLMPHQFSRSNDSRRGGFVEGQGGGTLLLTRGDIAAKLGLPVLGVVGFAGSYGDGIQRSIPAPGLGMLAAAAGGEHSALGQALAAYNLGADDIGVVYKHDTSTHANDINESKIHHTIQHALGRAEGNPLWVVSQKTLTGHSKGGAAAWQTIGLCQTLGAQVISPNRNLDDVDPQMKDFDHLCFTTVPVPLATPLRAGLVTSLGFGHVGALVMVLHPDFFIAALEEEDRQRWLRQATERLEQGARTWSKVRLGQDQAFSERTHRRFVADDGTPAQTSEEMAMLLDPAARLSGGVYTSKASTTKEA